MVQVFLPLTFSICCGGGGIPRSAHWEPFQCEATGAEFCLKEKWQLVCSRQTEIWQRTFLWHHPRRKIKRTTSNSPLISKHHISPYFSIIKEDSNSGDLYFLGKWKNGLKPANLLFQGRTSSHNNQALDRTVTFWFLVYSNMNLCPLRQRAF